MYGTKRHQGKMQKMWNRNRLLGIKKTKRRGVSKVRTSKSKSVRKQNTEVETTSGRYDLGRGAFDFSQQLWDANEKQKRVGQVLRPTTREEKAERVQEKKERTHQRFVKLSRLNKTEGYKELEKLLKRWEFLSYYNLRFPERRKDKVSREYYNGFQNGALWVIEGLRNEMVSAIAYLQRQADKKDDEQT